MQGLSYVRLFIIVICSATCSSLAFAQPMRSHNTVKINKAPDSLFIARVGDDLYYTPDNCCGLVAAYMVTNDFGNPIALRDLASQLPVSVAGTSMLDLDNFLQKRGLDTAAVDVNPEELYAILERDPHVRAIVLIWPRHWITLFSANQEKFDSYNYPERAEIDKDEFSRVFAKRALLVGSSRGALDYLRSPLSSWVRVIVSDTLTGLSACLIILTLWIVYRRFLCSSKTIAESLHCAKEK